MFIAIVFSFFDLECMRVNWGRLLIYTIVGGTPKHCVDQYIFVSLFARG